MARKKKDEEVTYSSEDYGETSSYETHASNYKVKISESIHFKSKQDGKIIESSVEGAITVVNNGDNDRIWDIDIEVTNEDNTDLIANKFHIAELDPKEEWTKEYQVNITTNDTPPIKVIELIDTFPDTEGESHIFMLNKDSTGQKTTFGIILENTRDSTVSDIAVTKEIIDEYREVRIITQSDGDAKYNSSEGIIEWTIEKLRPQETTELVFDATVLPTEVKSMSSGEINISYKIESGTYSGLRVDFIDGWSKQMHLVDRDEREEEPDVWDCKMEFRNQSEFPMKLQKFKLVFGDTNTEFAVIGAEPNVIVGPHDIWESEPWNLTSEDEPTYYETFLYTVEAEIEVSLTMSATIEPVELYVLALEGTKELSDNVVQSYRESTIDATIDVTTKGSAPIDVFVMEDTIPMDFKNPEKEEIEFLIGGKQVPTDDLSLSFEPETNEVSAKRILKVEVSNVLEEFGELKDETSVNVKYPLTAVSPDKDTTYAAPVLFQAYIKPFPTPVETYIELSEPITVIHERRRTRVGKTIKAGSKKSLFNVLLIYRNKGDATKNDIIISDFVPAGFTIEDSNTDFEEVSKEGGKLLKWTIKEIVPEEEIEINYSIKGKGKKYSLKNIETKAFK